MSRRVWIAALFVSLVIIRPGFVTDLSQPLSGVRNVEAAASGATTPAPINRSFDLPVADAVLRSPAAALGKVEPPGWKLDRGSARPEKEQQTGRGFALLEKDDATLTSSAFTISPQRSKLSFQYKLVSGEDKEASLKVYVLSGANYATETLAFETACRCSDSDWRKQFIDITPWASENVQLRFVQDGAKGGSVAITDVASDLIEPKIGRDRRSAFAGDPVDTSNGNLFETVMDIAPIPGKGVPLVFTRYYNSDSTFTGNLGPKWTHTYSTNITAEADNSRTIRYPDGKTANFAVTGASPPVFDSASSATTPYDWNLTWTHTTGSGSNRILLVAAYSTYGSVTGITYDSSSLSSITLDSGGKVWYMLNPPTGSYTVNVSFNNLEGPLGEFASAMTFSNVAQQTPTGAESVYGPTLAADPNDLAADFFAAAGWSQPTAGQTQRTSATADIPYVGSYFIGASTKPGNFSSSVYLSWGYASPLFLRAVRLVGTGSSPSLPHTFTSPAGNFDTLVLNSDGTHALTTSGQVVHSFDSSGRLTSIVDRNGNTTSVAYNGSRLSSVTDAGGRSLTFTTDATSGRISQISDPASRAVSFNTTGNLTSATNVLGGTTTYTYDSSNRFLTETNPLSNLVVENTYDSAGRVVKQRQNVNSTNIYTCFYYGTSPSYTDSNCTGTSPSPSSGQVVVVNPRGYKTTYDFDSSFRTTQVKDHKNGVTSYTYDSSDNTLCVTDPLSNKTSLTYDSKGNVTQVIDALNTTSSCTLITNGVKTTITYTSKNDVDLITDPLGRKKAFVYDTPGNLIRLDEQDASSSVKRKTCLTVNSAGQVTETIQSTTLTDCTGNKAKIEYNSYGLATGVIDPRFSSQGTPPKTTITYDNASRPLTATNELSHTSTFTYNGAGQVLTAKDNLNNTTTNTYDTIGRHLTVTDATSKQTSFGYDALNRLTSVTDAASGVASSAYDNNGNRTSVTNPRGKTTTFTYDEIDRLLTSTDPNSKVTTLVYDAHSRVTQRTDGRGCATTYSYDKVDRLSARSYTTCGGITTANVSYQYDALGNRTQMIDGTGTTTYAFDALNHLTSVTFPGSKVVAYQYSNAGNRSRITYPDAKYVDYGYDAANNVASLTDWAGRATSQTYDAVGQLRYTWLPASTGLATERAYDDADRLYVTSLWNNCQTACTNVRWIGSSFNAVSNRTAVYDTLVGNTTFAYDNLHRLTSVTYPGPTTDTYTYDANGNRTAKNSATYTYDNADQMTVAGGVSYGYDNNGNQTSRGADTFVYDHENRLKSATVAGSTTTYTYNGDGLRTTRSSAGVTTSYVWDVAGGLPVLLREEQGSDQSVSGLVAHWPFSEGSGTTTADASGGGNTGTLNGPSWTTGHDGSALSFGAPTNHNVDVANFGSFNRMSVAAWVYRTGATATTRETIVSYKEGNPANCGFVFSLNEGGANQYPRIWVMVNGAWTYAEQATAVPLNTWVHLAATYDGSTIRLYRDGVQVASTAASGNMSQCTQGMRIGNRAPGSYNWGFAGKIDDARIYDRAISATEVGYVMNGAPSAPSTTYVYGAGGMLYWVDSSGNATYRMADALGSTMALANSASVVTDSYTYDIFGAVRSHSGTNGTEFTFTGEQNDPNGLEYLRARYYDNATGRFLGRDPLGGGYPYGGNNPANMVDPTGLSEEGAGGCTFYNYVMQAWLDCGLQNQVASMGMGLQPALVPIGDPLDVVSRPGVIGRAQYFGALEIYFVEDADGFHVQIGVTVGVTVFGGRATATVYILSTEPLPELTVEIVNGVPTAGLVANVSLVRVPMYPAICFCESSQVPYVYYGTLTYTQPRNTVPVQVVVGLSSTWTPSDIYIPLIRLSHRFP